jgi:predicted lipid carrier protein YhbT
LPEPDRRGGAGRPLTQINIVDKKGGSCHRTGDDGVATVMLSWEGEMDEAEFPTLLARGVIATAPPPILELGAGALLHKMGRNHPELFRVLSEFRRTRILFELTDLPHRFVLQFGDGAPSLKLAGAGEVEADASVKGALEALLALLEGRIDGDALFFTREIVIAGDTSAVVALRNILDRESIVLLDEAVSLLGPLRRFARTAVLNWERRAERLRDLIRPARDGSDAARAAAAEQERLHAEIEALKTRLSKLEARHRRKEGQAA